MLTEANPLSRKSDANVDLNRVVTPMLDMTFQVLFFLIMSFRMPSLEGQINIALPKEDGGPGEAALPLDVDPAEEYILRLYIAERNGGNAISEMKWRKKGQRIDDAAVESIPRIDPADRNESVEAYRNLDTLIYGLVVKLRQHQPRPGAKAPPVKIECPDKLMYADLLRVMDVLRRLEFKTIGFIPVNN